MSPSSKLLEFTLFAIFVIGMAAGLIAAFRAPDFYETVLSAEDGPLEWITALSLLLASLICFSRAITRTHKGRRFVLVFVAAGVVLLFGAGEEISWGQRIVGWSSGEFWQQNNLQDETNLHNLIVGEVKINRVLFGVTLTSVLFFYFVVLPVLVARISSLARFLDRWFVPIARPVHAAAFVLAMLAMTVIPSGRAPELGEFALGLLLAAVVLRPANRQAIL